MKKRTKPELTENFSILERVMSKSPNKIRTNGMNDSMKLPEAYANRPQSAYTMKRILEGILSILVIACTSTIALAQGVTTSNPLFSAPYLVEEQTASCEEAREEAWGISKVTCYGTPFVADYHNGGHICAQNVYRLLFVNEREGWFRYEHTRKGQPIEWLAEDCETGATKKEPHPHY